MNKTTTFLNSLNIGPKSIILGCSGGPDSMCLLNILHKENYKVICAHVNHNIRKESKEEYIFVKNYCETHDIIFEGLELPENLNEDEAFYRKKRYEFYKQLARKYKTSYIMTAHHGDDLTETILMRIARGSNLKGYAGFEKIYKEDNYTFIKPLIFYTKTEIETYIRENEIPFVMDKTNDENIYTRNKYRHNILPFLKSEVPNVHLKFLQYSEELNETNRFINSSVQKSLERNYRYNRLTISTFLEEHELIQRKTLEAILRDIYKNDVDKLGVFHIQKILENIKKGKNFTINLPLNILIVREYDSLKIEPKETYSSYNLPLEKKTTLPNGDIIEIIEASDDTSNYTTRLNAKDLKMPLYIRTREPGDRMQIKNLNGTKKLSSIFIDSKVEPSKRNSYPILVDSENSIIWLPGLRKSKFDSELNEKYDIILRYTRRKENFDEKQK